MHGDHWELGPDVWYVRDAVAPELLLRGAAAWQLIERMNDAISVVDDEGTLSYVNAAWLSLMQLPDTTTAAAALSHQLDAPHPAYHAVDLALKRALRGEEVHDSEMCFTQPDDAPMWLSISAHSIVGSEGQIVGAFSISRDITRVRLLQEQHDPQPELLESIHEDACFPETADQRRSRIEIQRLIETAEARAEELETIINSMGDAVVITDEKSGARRWNPAYARLLGVPEQGETSAHRIGRFNLRDWNGKPVLPETMTAFRAVREGTDVAGEYIVTTQAGTEAYLRVHAFPLRDATGCVRGAVIVLRDMTAVRAADKQKDEFLSLVSHELRTPVTIIGGFTQVLRRSVESADASETQRRLGIIERQVRQLTALINDLLDLSRVDHGNFDCALAPLDYHSLVMTVIDEIQQLNPTRGFRLAMSGSLSVQGDAARLRQVLANLLDNAVKHGPPNSEITVTVEADEKAVTTYVCDAGPALPLDERHRVFDRFYRVAPGPIRNGGSLGLGLFICRSIVESHGGRIWVADDDHSSFAFSLRSISPNP